MTNDTNFLKVTTNVTVSDVHSVLNLNTLLMQMYCVTTLTINEINPVGMPAVYHALSVNMRSSNDRLIWNVNNKKPGRARAWM